MEFCITVNIKGTTTDDPENMDAILAFGERGEGSDLERIVQRYLDEEFCRWLPAASAGAFQNIEVEVIDTIEVDA